MEENIEHRREMASQQLREAWMRGDIDAGEHERRTTALRHATTTEQIDAIESGAGAATSRAGEPGRGISPIPTLEPRAQTEPGTDLEPRPSASAPSVISQRVAKVYPMIAFVGFMACGFAFTGWAWAWLWFLTIPIVMGLCGADDDEADKRQRRRERRQLKRERRQR